MKSSQCLLQLLILEMVFAKCSQFITKFIQQLFAAFFLLGCQLFPSKQLNFLKFLFIKLKQAYWSTPVELSLNAAVLIKSKVHVRQAMLLIMMNCDGF